MQLIKFEPYAPPLIMLFFFLLQNPESNFLMSFYRFFFILFGICILGRKHDTIEISKPIFF